MDYEKAYKEALERAKEKIKDAGGNEGRKRMIRDIFPELAAEIEDERIRKELISFFKDGISTTVAKKDIVSWLEKQKEQKPEFPKPHKGDDTNPYDMSVSEAQEYAINRGFGIPFNDGEVYVDERHLTQTIGNILRWADEHPKEQKPVALDDETMTDLDRALCIVKDARGKLPSYQSDDGIYECNKAIVALEHILYNGLEKTEEPQDYSGLTDFERAIHRGFLCAGVENVPVNIIKETAKDCLAQIKPAEWSEEDESMLWNIISIVGQCKSVQADSMLDWLKSLRPQPKGVFEQAVRAIYEMCHSYRNKGVFTDERACDFMGNVRLKCKDAIECSPILDEPHWKPSEEQMTALATAVVLATKDSSMQISLRSLYDDLKKL